MGGGGGAAHFLLQRASKKVPLESPAKLRVFRTGFRALRNADSVPPSHHITLDESTVASARARARNSFACSKLVCGNAPIEVYTFNSTRRGHHWRGTSLSVSGGFVRAILLWPTDVVILDSPKLRMEDWTLFRVMCSGTSTSHSLVSMISLVRGRYDLVRFIKETQAQGLYVCLRIGPFIETLRVNGITAGGFHFGCMMSQGSFTDQIMNHSR
ncbi:uncharacterized protein LOC120002474 [Tripterygium wilfordii]|uniref:uncharacterized protein LOC120002474 n=1 Tax=Tripterygium wilfordii TaxID=458696 RepID=UPI0018F83DF6|nr:uncharacterized protein LOC120002474 [Tripterygium wilfordii]